MRTWFAVFAVVVWLAGCGEPLANRCGANDDLQAWQWCKPAGATGDCPDPSTFAVPVYADPDCGAPYVCSVDGAGTHAVVTDTDAFAPMDYDACCYPTTVDRGAPDAENCTIDD